MPEPIRRVKLMNVQLERIVGICPMCSDEFAPKRSDQVWCGRRCARRAERMRARGTYEQEPPPSATLHDGS